MQWIVGRTLAREAKGQNGRRALIRRAAPFED